MKKKKKWRLKKRFLDSGEVCSAWHVIGVNPEYYYSVLLVLVNSPSYTNNFTGSASLLYWHMSCHESAVTPIQLCSLCLYDLECLGAWYLLPSVLCPLSPLILQHECEHSIYRNFQTTQVSSHLLPFLHSRINICLLLSHRGPESICSLNFMISCYVQALLFTVAPENYLGFWCEDVGPIASCLLNARRWM